MKVGNIIIAILLLIIGAGGGMWYASQANSQPLDDLSIRTTYDSPETTEKITKNSLKRDVDPITLVTDIETATIKLFEETAPSVCFINTSKLTQRGYWSRRVYETPSGTGSMLPATSIARTRNIGSLPGVPS